MLYIPFSYIRRKYVPSILHFAGKCFFYGKRCRLVFLISVNSRLRNVLSPCNILQCVSAFVCSYTLNVCIRTETDFNVAKCFAMKQSWRGEHVRSFAQMSKKTKILGKKKLFIYKRIHKNTSHTHNLGGIDKVFRWKNFDVRVIKVSYSFFSAPCLPPSLVHSLFVYFSFCSRFLWCFFHSFGLSIVSGHFLPIDFGSKLHIERWLHTFTQRLS